MYEPSTQENLLAQFRQFLAQGGPVQGEAVQGAEPEEQRSVDLYSLFLELAALKNEVRIESRQVKDALDVFRTALDERREAQHTQQEALERHGRDRLRPVLLGLLELRDSMTAGLRTLRRKPSRWTRFLAALKLKDLEWRDRMVTGQEMILRRLDRLLATQQVERIETTGQRLDPMRMQAVEVSRRTDIDPGTVTGEVRAGYVWEQEILRPAEVIVSRLDASGDQDRKTL